MKKLHRKIVAGETAQRTAVSVAGNIQHTVIAKALHGWLSPEAPSVLPLRRLSTLILLPPPSLMMMLMMLLMMLLLMMNLLLLLMMLLLLLLILLMMMIMMMMMLFGGAVVWSVCCYVCM
jgi:hypothetical protein